jgi:hypothetical protein
MDESDTKKANIVRYGLMVIPPVAWVVAFAPLFMISNGARMDWVSDALVPSLIEALVVGVVCAVVWFAYKKVAFKA